MANPSVERRLHNADLRHISKAFGWNFAAIELAGAATKGLSVWSARSGDCVGMMLPDKPCRRSCTGMRGCVPSSHLQGRVSRMSDATYPEAILPKCIGERDALALNCTTACPPRGDFCCHGCHPNRQEQMPLDQALRLVRETSNIPSISCPGLAGGEPRFFWDEIQEVMSEPPRARALCERSLRPRGIQS